MKYLKNFFKRLISLFSSGAAKRAYDQALELAPQLLPIIEMVTTIGVTLTPPKWDDALWAAIKLKFPAVWDGTFAEMTVEERKLYLLGLATELTKEYFPKVSTSVARLAVQAAYTGMNASEPPPDIPPGPDNQ